MVVFETAGDSGCSKFRDMGTSAYIGMMALQRASLTRREAEFKLNDCHLYGLNRKMELSGPHTPSNSISYFSELDDTWNQMLG